MKYLTDTDTEVSHILTENGVRRQASPGLSAASLRSLLSRTRGKKKKKKLLSSNNQFAY